VIGKDFDDQLQSRRLIWSCDARALVMVPLELLLWYWLRSHYLICKVSNNVVVVAQEGN